MTEFILHEVGFYAVTLSTGTGLRYEWNEAKSKEKEFQTRLQAPVLLRYGPTLDRKLPGLPPSWSF